MIFEKLKIYLHNLEKEGLKDDIKLLEESIQRQKDIMDRSTNEYLIEKFKDLIRVNTSILDEWKKEYNRLS